jgi:hypothetical protein
MRGGHCVGLLAQDGFCRVVGQHGLGVRVFELDGLAEFEGALAEEAVVGGGEGDLVGGRGTCCW